MPIISKVSLTVRQNKAFEFSSDWLALNTFEVRLVLVLRRALPGDPSNSGLLLDV